MTREHKEPSTTVESCYGVYYAVSVAKRKTLSFRNTHDPLSSFVVLSAHFGYTGLER